jgi:hypothetical protein
MLIGVATKLDDKCKFMICVVPGNDETKLIQLVCYPRQKGTTSQVNLYKVISRLQGIS